MQSILLCFIFINGLYMFRTFTCPSSGVLKYRLFGVQSCALFVCQLDTNRQTVHKTTHQLRRTTATTPRAYTTRGRKTPEDGHVNVRNMQRPFMKINHSKIVYIKLVHFPYYSLCFISSSKTRKYVSGIIQSIKVSQLYQLVSGLIVSQFVLTA